MKKLIAAALLLGSATPALAQETYRAGGTEPFWSLRIDARTMTFEAPGQRPVTVATPRVIHGFAGEIWQSRRINVNTNHIPCNNGMNDRQYADTVTVTVDGRTYKGCGGEYAVAQQPQGSSIEGEWRIEAVNGRAVAPRTMPSVSFRGDRISGNAGCNRFNGSFQFARGRLRAGPLASTRMACADRFANAQEAAILRIFEQRLSVTSNPRGKLVLTARDGKTLTLVRAGRR